MKPRFVFSISLLLAACSSSSPSPGGPDSVDAAASGAGSSTDSDSGSGGPASASSSGGATAPAGHDATIVLLIPPDYIGTLAKLDLAYNRTAAFLGPPTGTLYEGTPGGIAAGQPLTVVGDATGVSGSYFVVAILYMKGGGVFVPSPGVDYVGETASPVAFDGNAISLGTLPVIIAPADGGL
jgi:hypothetical protein